MIAWHPDCPTKPGYYWVRDSERTLGVIVLRRGPRGGKLPMRWLEPVRRVCKWQDGYRWHSVALPSDVERDAKINADLHELDRVRIAELEAHVATLCQPHADARDADSPCKDFTPGMPAGNCESARESGGDASTTSLLLLEAPLTPHRGEDLCD